MAERCLHALIDQSLMRRVLVDDNDRLRGLRDDVILVHLRPHGTKRLRSAAASLADSGGISTHPLGMASASNGACIASAIPGAT